MTESRRLCQTLLNGSPEPSDLHAAEAFLKSALAAASRAESAGASFREPWRPSSPPDPDDPRSRNAILRALAPALLLDGVWLARAAQPATAHRATESHLFELYCRIVGLDDPSSSPPLRLRASLTTAGVPLPDLDHPGFFHEPGFPDFALTFPCLHLCLLHRPRTFFSELLGYTLAHAYRETAWWDAPEPVGPSFKEQVRLLASAALESYPSRDAHVERVRAGWALYRHALDTLLREAGEFVGRKSTAEAAMVALLKTKLPEAIGHHRRIKVAGRSLDQWLAESGTDCRPLLRALRDSPEVDRACPAASRLIRAMDFGGPMFGVFDGQERQVCLAWIEDPVKARPTNLAQIPGSGPPTIMDTISGRRGRKAAPRGPARRRLYALLLRAESPADCPPAADAFVQRMLRRARWLRLMQPAYRRFPYSPEAFRRYTETLHRRELDRYHPPSGPPRIGREFCRWAVLQLAPAILVDGSWLAGIATASERLDAIGRHLLKTYADELGNGRPEWNHPNVYRRLLASLNIELPSFDSEAFAQDSRFVDAAFDIPVYLLAIGLRAQRYFPELLGLNLAIELSGLGAGYMRTIDLLRHHGIDPAIVQLHLSIDNLSSGHAARARDAITLYLDAIGRREGLDAVQAQWRRIWTGYGSLNAAASTLAASLALRYFRHRARQRVDSWLFAGCCQRERRHFPD